MGVSFGPNGTERTINLRQKGVHQDNWESLELQVKAIEGVSYAKIEGNTLSVNTRDAQKVFPKIDLLIEQLRETGVPVGITQDRRPQITEAPASTRGQQPGYVNRAQRGKRASRRRK